MHSLITSRFNKKILHWFYKIICACLILALFYTYWSYKKSQNISIHLKGMQYLKINKTFKNLKVGGLSGLFFDKDSGQFLALSDAKKNHRFYKLQLAKHPYKMHIKEQVLLRSPQHKVLKQNLDPEALVMHKSHIFIASEGQQIFKIHEATQIFSFNKQAVLKQAWPVPKVFWKKHRKRQDHNFGQQENKGFESLSLDSKSLELWTATENPLKQDLIFNNQSLLRLSAFSVKTKKMLVQYPYILQSPNFGLVALEFLRHKEFISLERAYDKNKKLKPNAISLFYVDCRQASPIQTNVQKKRTACFKKQIWNSAQETRLKAENLEGMALGPKLANNKQLLVLVSDNNFNNVTEKTQFLFFEIFIPKKSWF